MPKFLNKLFNIKPESKSASETESKTKSKYKKVVVFDLDET